MTAEEKEIHDRCEAFAVALRKASEDGTARSFEGPQLDRHRLWTLLKVARKERDAAYHETRQLREQIAQLEGEDKR